MRRCLFLFTIFCGSNVYCQETISLSSYLSQLEDTTNKTFFYKEAWVDSIRVENQVSEDWLEVIKKSMSAAGFKVYTYKKDYVFIYPNKLEFERESLLIGDQGNFKAENIKRVGDPLTFDENKTYQLRGTITNEADEKLAGVNIVVNDEIGARTDASGSYSLDLKPGNYVLEYSYVGLEPEFEFITFYSTGNLSVTLFPNSQLLDEVVIEGNYLEQNTGKTQVGVQRISVAKLEKLPSFAGTMDVVKGASTLPGVSISGESSSYLNVRGGGNDQTLMLMNNTTIYNPGHLLGFFSVYNGDFISDMTLFKGNIPAKYGIRSSSVLDVKMNKWAKKKVNIYGGIGIANYNLGVKTRLLDDKIDIHFGGRISNINWILDLLPNKDLLQSKVQFGDFNFNSRYLANAKNSFFVSSYYGEDYFKYSDRVIYRWNTFNNSIKWSRLLGNDFVLETDLLSSRLENSSEGIELNEEFFFENGITELSLKSTISNEDFEGGLEVSNYDISLGKIAPTKSNSQIESQSLEKEHALNVAVFASYTYPVSERLNINPGLRFNHFMNLGPSTINIYEPNSSYIAENVVRQEAIGAGATSSSRSVFEPRLGINYKWNDQSIKFGYSRINQFLHLISNTVLVNPSRVWKASDRYIPATSIDQYSIGYQKDIEKLDLTVSVDGFYKKIDRLLEYRDGATLLLNENLEQDILSGQGTSSGLEFLVSKNRGLLTGLVSYTYSRSFIKVVDEKQNVSINSGERYPHYSDRPHSLKANLDYKFSKKWTLSSNFTYTSGAPITATVATYQIEGIIVPFVSARNSQRIPDYHRLDLVLTLKSRIRRSKKNNDRWVLSLYNVYGRDNVATIFFSSENNNMPSQPFKLINIGRVVPTLTYKFEF